MDRPAALVVYESMFGNTEEVAKAVAEGLRLEGIETTVVEARSAPRAVARDLDLLVVGAPTHAFSLSRAASRQAAVSQGAVPERADLGVREWLESCRHDRRSPVALAAFDTRVSRVRWLPQSASAAAARIARKHDFRVVAHPIGFVVEDIKGPLRAGELDRAVAWGRELAIGAQDRAAVAHLRTPE
jgi:menaquinone-dependent protoporphyrinogen IX oxidase